MSLNAATLEEPALRAGLAERRARSVAAAACLLGLAALAGTGAALQPLVTLAPFAALALVALAFLAPVTHLMMLLLTTSVVGYAIQHKFGSHLLPSDAFLLTGLLRAAVTLLRQRLEARRLAVVALMSAFAAATVLQVVHGLETGANSSEAGAEGRVLLGFCSVLIAIPILNDADGRRRLARGLVILGLVLGLWGLATWGLGIKLGENVDVGLRTSTGFATSGSGQLHGGLYGYPVAVVMAATVLLANHAGRGRLRWALVAVLATNLACLVLTYERTFWLTTLVTLAFVVVKMGRGRRLRAGVMILATAVAVLGLLATLFPSDLTAIRDRALSLGQSSNSGSVHYRVAETRHVLDKIKARPLFGSGLGDTIHWGQPWAQLPPKTTWFAHNGYLWVIWKTGVCAAALLFALLGWALLSRAPPEQDPAMRSFRVAAQGGLLVLLLSSVTFPSLNSLSITAVMGVLVAVCFMPCAHPCDARRQP